MLNIKKVDCPKDKLAIKCPYAMTPTRIVIHNTANDASAESEIAYMHRNGNEVSFHYAVDDKGAVQGIELNRNAWHASDGNGKGNREGIAIEICYSKSGGTRFDQAQRNAAELTAKLLKDYGWGIDRVTKHQDYGNHKYCPHRTLRQYGWDFFLNLVKGFMETPKPTAPTVKPTAVNVTYQVWDGAKKVWLPNVVNDSDYAGVRNHNICGVYANLSQGNIFYKVHVKGGKWLPEVKNRTDYAGIFGKPIDGIMARTDTNKKVEYRVHLRRQNKWLPWVTGFCTTDKNNGYAGILGQEIDGLQIRMK